MHWLSKVCAAVGNIYLRKLTEMPSLRGKTQQPAWGRSREFEITTRSVGRNQLNQSTTGDLDEEEMDEEDENELDHGRRKRKVAFMPSPGEALSYSARLYRRPEWIFFFGPDTTHTIYYRGHWLKVRLDRGSFLNGRGLSTPHLR